MAKFECTVCGYIYDEDLGDPDNGIEPGTLFADLPDDWECPLCSVGKEDFEEKVDGHKKGAAAAALFLWY